MRRADLLALAMLACGSVAEAAPPAFRVVALEADVPAPLLYAVALQESQTRGKPWPWTLNACGTPERHDSRAQAHRAIERYRSAGCESVDVGTMQVNWRWHSHRFRSTWAALDPWANLRAGAAILRECYDRTREWLAAAGCYHHPSNAKRARAYAAQVARRMPRDD